MTWYDSTSKAKDDIAELIKVLSKQKAAAVRELADVRARNVELAAELKAAREQIARLEPGDGI